DKKDRGHEEQKDRSQEVKAKRELPVAETEAKRFRLEAVPALEASTLSRPPAFSETVEGFYSFMVERECLRLRRAAGGPLPWTGDLLLQCVRLANVKREHDRTGTLVSRLLALQEPAWHASESDAEQRTSSVRDHVLSVAIWRRFGSLDFVDRLGFVRCPSSEEEFQELLSRVMST
ncbi:unnamed protein product, partial [Polarella glacialis]